MPEIGVLQAGKAGLFAVFTCGTRAHRHRNVIAEFGICLGNYGCYFLWGRGLLYQCANVAGGLVQCGNILWIKFGNSVADAMFLVQGIQESTKGISGYNKSLGNRDQGTG